MYHGILHALGSGKVDINNLIETEDVRDAENDWVPGDWGAIDNRLRRTGASAGENLIYLGNSQYWGHPGFGNGTDRDKRIHSKDQWFKRVNEWGIAQYLNWRKYPRAGLT